MKIKVREQKIVVKEIELLPCPFCGSEDIDPVSIEGSWGYSSSKDYVKCNSCGAQGGVVEDGKLDDAIANWNMRAEDYHD